MYISDMKCQISKACRDVFILHRWREVRITTTNGHTVYLEGTKADEKYEGVDLQPLF